MNLGFASIEADKEIKRKEKKNALFNPFTKKPKMAGLQLDPDETNDDDEGGQKNQKSITGEKQKSLIQQRGAIDLEKEYMLQKNIRYFHHAVKDLKD